MLEAVIFDMDGLMFDTERVFVDAWDYVGEKLGLGKAGHMVYKTLGLNVNATIQVWQEEYGDRYNKDDMLRLSKEYMKDYYNKNTIAVKEGLYELLDYLKEKRYKLAVATSTKTETALRNLSSTRVAPYFQAVIGGDTVANAKPAPDIYLKVCEALKVDPKNCLALEDSPNGIRAAYHAGIKVIMIPDLIQPDAATIELLYAKLSNLTEVITLLEES